MSRSRSTDLDRQAADWVTRRDAGFNPLEEAEFTRWRDHDRAHADAVARHDATWSALEKPLRSGQADLIVQRLAERAGRRRRRRLVTGSVVALVILVGAMWSVRRLTPPPVAPSHAVVILPETRTLPDGSVVQLKFGAEITVDYTGPLRRVALIRGEAHFAVAKDPDRPFVVAARGFEVRAVGTAFSVQSGSAQVEVLVTEGRVAVQQPALAAAPAQTLALVDAGTRLLVDVERRSDAAPVVSGVSEAELAQRLAWRAPKLEFSETPLADAVALMNRQSGGHGTAVLVLDDPALARETVSGLFRSDNTDTFVRLLEANFGVRAERAGDRIILRRAR